MRVVLDFEAEDIERLRLVLARSRQTVRSADELDLVDAAKYALDTLNLGGAPGYVRKRVVKVQGLVAMLEDETWALPDPERGEILETLVYFSDPEDLISDHVEIIGLLDDAILLEFLLQRMRHVRRAYEEFCAFRAELAATTPGTADRSRFARDLALRRTQLQERMRRQLRRRAATPPGA